MSGRKAGPYGTASLLFIAGTLLSAEGGGASGDREASPPGSLWTSELRAERWVIRTADVRIRRSYWLPGSRVLALMVPGDWTESQKPAGADAPLTITFRPVAGRAFQVLVSVIPESDRRPDVHAIVERSGHTLLASAVEDRLVLEELRGAQVSGYFFRLTDRAPKPDGYKYLIQGAVRLSDLMLTFTVLTNQPDAPEVGTALEMLRAAETSVVM